MAQHGDYDASRGWYSSLTKAWHRDPTKIGTVQPKWEPTAYDRQEWANSPWSGKQGFKPDPQKERLLELRDSDRAEDRAKFERLAKGSTAIALGGYEQAKAQSGGEA